MVEDNGVGIEEEKLQQIRQEMINYKGDSMKIGLGNVYSRLKILYGEKVSMDIESEERKGCKITIRRYLKKHPAEISTESSRAALIRQIMWEEIKNVPTDDSR